MQHRTAFPALKRRAILTMSLRDNSPPQTAWRSEKRLRFGCKCMGGHLNSHAKSCYVSHSFLSKELETVTTLNHEKPTP